jgi:hypothetical protein
MPPPPDPKHPQPGDLVIDASDVQVVDVTGKKVKNLTKLRRGYDAAVTNVANQPAAMLARAGIGADDLATVNASAAVIARVDQLLPAAEKLAELLRETKQVHSAKVSAGLHDFGSQVKRRAKRDPNGDEILAALEVLLTWTGGPAKKAVATKVKEGKIKPKPPKHPKKPKGGAPAPPHV